MKLTEQQLSQLFIQSKFSEIKSDIENINDFSEASNARIAAVEKIADNTSLSSSYHVINNLKSWSKSVANDIQQLNYSIFDGIYSWFKPGLATVALASIVYISYPEFNNSIQNNFETVSISNQKKMFTANFEDSVVTNKSTSKSKTNSNITKDVIYSGGFG